MLWADDKRMKFILNIYIKENGNLPLAIWVPVSTFFATLVAQKHKLSVF